MSLPNAKDDARQRNVASVEERIAELQGAQRQESVEGFMDGGRRMRLPNTAHTFRPWRIHEFTRDFRLEDVWALPTPGGPDDFPRLVRQMSSGLPKSLLRAGWHDLAKSENKSVITVTEYGYTSQQISQPMQCQLGAALRPAGGLRGRQGAWDRDRPRRSVDIVRVCLAPLGFRPFCDELLPPDDRRGLDALLSRLFRPYRRGSAVGNAFARTAR